MKLIVHELTQGSNLNQTFTAPRDCNIVAVRPHILRYGLPSGNLQLSIEEVGGSSLASTTLTISSIASANYFHGYVKFDIVVGLRKGVEYRVKLEGVSGYTFSESNYIGWCNGFDLKKYKASYQQTNSMDAPLDFELWERRTK